MKFITLTLGAALLAAASLPAAAQLSVDDAWIRATVPGQKSTGAFMTLRAQADTRLVGAQSEVARSTEVHEMRMDGDVMRMRQVEAVPVPAGQAVELKPGGYHIMLMDVHRQMKTGEVVPLTLITESADGQRHSQQVDATVRPLATARDGTPHAAPAMKH
ncbi:MAG: copper chaperone PCu(A)C [Bordetella sp.]|nr:copper chaperone PCu(A)C [Bordetella sp.]